MRVIETALLILDILAVALLIYVLIVPPVELALFALLLVAFWAKFDSAIADRRQEALHLQNGFRKTIDDEFAELKRNDPASAAAFARAMEQARPPAGRPKRGSRGG